MDLLNGWLDIPKKHKALIQSRQFKQEKLEADRPQAEPKIPKNHKTKVESTESKEINVDEEETKKEEGPKDQQVHATMPDPVNYITLDGGPPNGGVPPDRLCMSVAQRSEDPPDGGMVPYFGPPHITQGFQNVSRFPSHPPAGWNLQNYVTNALPLQMVPVSAVPASNGGFTEYNQQNNAPAEQTHVHLHFNNDFDGGQHSVLRGSQEVRIKYIRYGVRPCDCSPNPYTGPMQMSPLIFHRNTPMKEFLQRLHTPPAKGHGVQKVFNMGGGVWGGGSKFEWGKGSSRLRLGETELGQGMPGQAIIICSWTSEWAA